MLIYAVNGCELIAPYVTQMKNPRREFPKAMIALSVMTAFLTIFGSFALGIYFNAYHLPNDLKMNGSYYAFSALGKQFGVGNLYVTVTVEVPSKLSRAQKQRLIDFDSDIELKQYDKMKKYDDAVQSLYGDKPYGTK